MNISRLFFCLFLLLFAVTGPVFSQAPILRFDRLTLEDGLSQGSIYDILQDRRGFMWFATEDGLNKYDGYDIKIFQPDPENPNTISYNYVTCLLQDRSGAIWIGTYGGGLDIFLPESEQFRHFTHNPDDPHGLSNNFITDIIESRSGEIWVATEEGLNRFNPETKEFHHLDSLKGIGLHLGMQPIKCLIEDRSGLLWLGTPEGLLVLDPQPSITARYAAQPGNPGGISHNQITKIYQDRSGMIWIGTIDGLNRFDPEHKRFFQYPVDPDSPGLLRNGHIYSILQDSSGIIWIGTLNGLHRLDPRSGEFTLYRDKINNLEGLTNNEIISIYEDRTGVIWVGTHIGLNKIDCERKAFGIYRNDPDDASSLSNNYVYAIYEDRLGIFWFGTYGGGLNRYDRRNERFTQYVNKSEDPGSLSNDFVRAITEDLEGNLWIGTFGGGLNLFNRKLGTFRSYRADPGRENNLSSDQVRCLHVDRKGALWIGTADGLNVFDSDNQSFKHYFHNSTDLNSLSHNFIYVVLEGKQGEIWIGSVNGLNRWDREGDIFTSYFAETNNRKSLSSSEILTLFQDRNEILWIGTPQGLNRFDPKTETFTYYMEKDGLPNNVVYAILEDNQGNLWLSTNKGISNFNPETGHFRNYGEEDGLQSNEFSLGARWERQNGEMFFAGVNGINYFFPESIHDNPYIPPLAITDFQIFNRSIPIGPFENRNPAITRSITESEEVNLSYRDRVITLVFSALHYASPEKNQYKYILENFENDWNEVGSRRFATYTNLPAGKYTFRVKGSNNDGIWNDEGVSLRIIITPPFWATWWFRIIIALILILTLMIWFQVRTSSIRGRNIRLETRVRERTAELQEEVTARKRLEAKALRQAALSRLIHETGQKVSQVLQLEELLPSIVTTIYETFDFYGVSLFLADDNSEYLTLKSAAGPLVDQFPPLIRLAFGEGMNGQAAATRKTQFSGDVNLNQHFFMVKDEKTKSELAIPIISANRIIGTLDIQSDQLDAFGPTDIAAMETLSTQIGKAIENARLYRKAQVEIMERKRAEETLKSALNEKEVLLKEIHHRVKNNMQIISSLLRLQSLRIKDSKTLAMFRESQSRIRSMALIHESLYQSRDLDRIDFAEYVKRLTRELKMAARGQDSRIKINLHIKDLYLDISMAIPSGLIINELVTNSLKHAFLENQEGSILVKMVSDPNGRYILHIKDTGIGLPPDFNIKKTKTLGLQLVHELVSQLEGTIEYSSGPGTEFKIRF